MPVENSSSILIIAVNLPCIDFAFYKDLFTNIPATDNFLANRAYDKFPLVIPRTHFSCNALLQSLKYFLSLPFGLTHQSIEYNHNNPTSTYFSLSLRSILAWNSVQYNEMISTKCHQTKHYVHQFERMFTIRRSNGVNHGHSP